MLETIIGGKQRVARMRLHWCNKVVGPIGCCPIAHNPELPDDKCKCAEVFPKWATLTPEQKLKYWGRSDLTDSI